LQLGKLFPSSSTDRSGQFSAASAARDRRRVAGLAWGSGILFVLPILYALGHGGPPHVESQGSYALLAGGAGAAASENVRLFPDEINPPVPVALVATELPINQKNAAESSHAPQQAPAQPKHDQYYCDFYAQAVTGNVKPEQAFRQEQTSGAIMGAVGGAVLGALWGGSGGHSGRSSVLGASAGLLAGATMGSSYAQRAADDIRSRYAAAYSACMKQDDGAAPNPAR